MRGVLSNLLWLAGLGHFGVLLASFQVPSRLRWKQDLTQLSPLNRKLMWTYGGFTVLTITAFGVLTLSLRAEFLRGDPATLGLAAFIAAYWTARLGVEFFYFHSADWPSGPVYRAGRIALTTLFTSLAATYWAVLLYHFRGGEL